ncbi:aspartate aminotransferase family protein [Streptomyces chrestomyceticus]|uniref:aspartate aminotransferase family protein n=1 Tax=Streptomyces chrestomyceticus TaxID=68185 RepID=UPI0037B18C36
MTHDDARNGTLLSRHQKIMPPWMPLFYEEPLEIVHGDGCMVTDSRDKTYMEFYSGIATNTVGYGVPGIEEAVRERLRTGVVHTSTFYLIREQVELAERIADASGIPDPVVFFTSSGTEAVETALLLATEYRDSHQVIALRYGYHGRSFGSLAVTGDRSWQGRGLSPLRVAYVHGGERRRGALAGLGDEDYVRACARDLEETIRTCTPERTAAMIAEPVQGIAGAVPSAPGQLAAYQEVLRRYDIPLIVDEVQTGWGRTGRYWGHQWHDVAPDVLVFAKGVGNGFAMGGLVGRRAIMSALAAPSISSFGGNPLSLTAALATLDHIDAYDLPARAGQVGALLLDGLRKSLADEPWVCEVRGQGLLLAVEYTHPGTLDPAPEMAAKVQEECRVLALLVGLGGSFGNCLRIMPPLTISDEQAVQATQIITAATREARG